MYSGTLLLQVCVVTHDKTDSNLNYTFHYADGNGNWSTDGCLTIVHDLHSVTCECDHLTNFACLIVSLRML